MRLAFDIETDGLLETVSKVHCLVIKDIDSGEVWECFSGGPKTIEEGLKLLSGASLITGHNVIKFDLVVLQMLYPGFTFDQPKVFDTLVASRLIHSNLQETDGALIETGQLMSKLFASHSLKAWGYRLGKLKGEYGEQENAWDVFTPEMLEYCKQDVEVTHALFSALEAKNYSQQALTFEHQVAWRCALMERSGWPFDVKAATELYGDLVAKREAIRKTMQETFEPLVIERVSEKTGKALKPKTIEFNPASRDQIAQRLSTKYGWKPTEFTPAGKPKVDEDTLKRLKYPEAQTLAEYFMLEKRIGQLAEGAQAWLKCERNGRIHGSINTNGAVTGRCTHNSPNIAQVPSVKRDKVTKEILHGIEGGYGQECRSLFTVQPGFAMVCADLSGLELRCLAHFMARWDDGEYANELLNGDIHSKNMQAAGLQSREQAKTFIYGFLYGAGDEKIGSIVGKGRDAGRKLKQKFLASLPALKKLREAVTKAAERGYLVGLDGRHLSIRSPHAALNTLLQSAGALVAKQWVLECFKGAEGMGLEYGWNNHFAMMGFVHDEVDMATRFGFEEDFGKMLVASAAKAGEHFNFRCPIGAEYKVGRSWAECH